MINYRKIKIISKNKISSVYEAEDIKTKRRIIIKEYYEDKYYSYYENEKNILMNYRIVFFPYLLEYIEEEKRKILVLEKVEGITIRQLVENKQINKDKTNQIIEKIINAVFCFYKKTEHQYYLGDLNVDNIIITAENEICIVDLQSVHKKNKMPSLATYTVSHPNYFKKNMKNKINADIYNIGMIWIYILTGKFNISDIDLIEERKRNIIKKCIFQKSQISLKDVLKEISYMNRKDIKAFSKKRVLVYEKEELALELYYSAKKRNISVCLLNLKKASNMLSGFFLEKLNENYYNKKPTKDFDLIIEVNDEIKTKGYYKIVFSPRAITIEIDSYINTIDKTNELGKKVIFCFFNYDKKYMLPKKVIENEIGSEYEYYIIRKHKKRDNAYETNYDKYLDKESKRNTRKMMNSLLGVLK